jgi:hypothetical protein
LTAERKYKVGDNLEVKLSGGRIVQGTIKAIINTTDGVRLQLSFGDETAKIFFWQIVERLVDRQCRPIVEKRRVRRQAGD